jgi:hypothetical protein
MIDLDKMTKQEIDSYHKCKRKKNLRTAMYFIYILIFMFVVSLGHSLTTMRDNYILEESLEQLSDYVLEMEKKCIQR